MALLVRPEGYGQPMFVEEDIEAALARARKLLEEGVIGGVVIRRSVWSPGGAEKTNGREATAS